MQSHRNIAQFCVLFVLLLKSVSQYFSSLLYSENKATVEEAFTDRRSVRAHARWSDPSVAIQRAVHTMWRGVCVCVSMGFGLQVIKVMP